MQKKIANFEHPTEWGEAGAWNFLIKQSNLMQNIFTDFEHPTQGVAMEFIGLAARLD